MKTVYLYLLLFLSSCIHLSYGQINTKKLDSLFDAISINNKMMGTIEILKDKKVVYQKAIGYSTTHNGLDVKNDAKTIFRIGSTTKMFTAIIVFQLVEEKKLSLETKVSHFFPEVPNSEKMTIATLLSHKDGLHDIVNDVENKEWLKSEQSRKNLLDTIIFGEANFKPEENFKYSNSAYLLLTYIIEKIEKKSYDKVLKKRIISKLNLKNTYCILSNKTNKKEALPYKYDKNWMKIQDIYFPNVVGVGDVLSNPTDLNKVITALFDGKLVSKENRALMSKIGNGGFGMGLMLMPLKNHLGYGHGGDTFGSHSVVTFYPNDNLCIALCINGQVISRNEIGLAVLKICFNQKYEIPSFKKITVDPELMQSYVGQYSCEQLPFKFNVFIKDEELYVQATNQEAIVIEPKSTHKFEVEELRAKFDFNPETKQLTFKQGNASFLFTKDESK